MPKGLPGASGLDRARKCPGSAVLPQAGKDSAAGQRGDDIHAFVLSTEPVAKRLEKVPPELRSFCEMIDIADVPPGEYEVSFAFDVNTGKGRRNTGKDFGPTEIVGRTDVVARTEIEGKPAVYIADLKTGMAFHVPPAKNNLQVGFYALAEARISGLDLAMVEILRVKDNGRIERDTAILDSWQLSAVEANLLDIVRSVENARSVYESGGSPTIRQGAHCDFCPAFHACPAKVSLALAITQDPQALEAAVMRELTPETAHLAYARYRAAQDVLTRIRHGIYGYALQNPIPIGNGQVLGPIDVTKPHLDGPKVAQLLEAKYGPGAGAEAVKLTATKAAIKNAIRAKVPYGSLRRSSDEFFRELQNAGGLAVTVRQDVRPHREGYSVEED